MFIIWIFHGSISILRIEGVLSRLLVFTGSAGTISVAYHSPHVTLDDGYVAHFLGQSSSVGVSRATRSHFANSIYNSKRILFTLKEGSEYRLKFSLTVSNNIVLGLKYTNVVWKTSMKMDNSKRMLGTFSPQQEPYTSEMEETTPSGMFARGTYSARTKEIKFVDDDGKCYLDMCYYFKIQKNWPKPS
nr:rho gdp-dissociation inhibitor 1 [Quercus suber]